MTKKTLLTMALGSSLIFMTGSVYANSPTKAPWLNFSGDVNFDATGKSADDYKANLSVDASLRFEVLVREGIKAVVKAQIEHELMKNNGRVTEDQQHKLEQIIEEAYISIETDKISGMPRAIITAGKHAMAFGQAISELPMYRDNLLYNLASEREMIGLTVTLPGNFFKLVDSIAVSVYENGAGDFKIADEKGASIKLTKKLSDRLTAQASALIKENAGTDKKEKRGSLGFVFNSEDGTYKVWAEGLVFDNNPMMPDTRWGSQVGGSMKLGKGAVVVEYAYLEKFAHELAVAYNMPVGSWLVISPEVRHSMDSTGTGTDSTRVGVRARVQFDRTSLAKLKTRG